MNQKSTFGSWKIYSGGKVLRCRNIKKGFLCFLILFYLVSCSSFSQNKVPYEIKGYIENTDGKEPVLLGEFINRENKRVSTFTVVFIVYDQNGELNIPGKSNLVIKLSNSVGGEERNSFSVPLKSLIKSYNTNDLNIDYLYVSRIEYSDGSVWTDPFGFYLY